MGLHLDLPTLGIMFRWGGLFLEFYGHPRMWGFSYHGQPCCRFFLEAGPFCIAWHNP